MAVRCKMTCTKKEPSWGDGATVEFMAMYDPDPASENGKFFLATPGAHAALSTVSPAAAAAFEPGKSYYVDFTPAD